MELAWVCDESNKQFQRVPDELVAEADKAAKDALEAEDMQVIAGYIHCDRSFIVYYLS